MGVLSGQRAIVIGGSSGLGLGTARLLARDGAHVTLAARTEDKLRQASQLLGEEGLPVSWVRCDATSAPDVRAAVEAAGEDGRLHIAVVVPGGGPPKGVLLYDEDEFSAFVDLNVRPVYLLLKHAGAAMVRAGGGSFVAVSSTVTAFSFRYLAAYSAGKSAVDQLIRVAANELGAAGVRVNGVRPGLTRTPGTQGFFDHPEYVEQFLAGQALPRPGEIEDIAQAIRFFAGPESSWVTGQLLTVDGGHTLRAAPDMKEMFDLEDQIQVVTQSTIP
jgi:NAD(P)-dependent dehydrogenase (short-subunit alcohol dehydrogenase family)